MGFNTLHAIFLSVIQTSKAKGRKKDPSKSFICYKMPLFFFFFTICSADILVPVLCFLLTKLTVSDCISYAVVGFDLRAASEYSSTL